jgi:RNA polymerase sigma factor (sigma-70 family)
MKNSTSGVNEDKVLWQNFKKGERTAFAKIYKQCYKPLFNYGIKIRNQHEFIKDCIQEVFYDIIRHRENLGDVNNILLYLITSLRRKIFRKLRSDFSFRCDTLLYYNHQFRDEGQEDVVFREQDDYHDKDLLRTFLDQLPRRQKEALLMKFYLNFDYEDIASLMDMNVQSVRNLIHRSIKSLRSRLKKEVFSSRVG